MDGLAVAAAVAEELSADRRPYVVALSALVGPGDEARYRANGFDACLGKPVRRAALIACVEAGIAARPHLL
jgi:CheY-like chemotaxis protein